MFFFDIPPSATPQGAQYYFNVVVYEVPMSAEYFHKTLGVNKRVKDIACIEKITDPRPKAFFFYESEEVSDEYEIYVYPHCVVEVYNNEVSWLDMLDFDTEGLWEI